MAAVDYFLKLDGIDGESQDAKHKGQIEIHSFSFGATQTGTSAAGGGAGAGKVSFQDMHFTHTVDKSSPKLMLACATGQHIKSAILTCRKAGGEQQEYLLFTLTDVLVSSVQVGGHVESQVVPSEQFSFNFSKIEFTYKPQKADGSLDSAIVTGYDVKQNKKV